MKGALAAIVALTIAAAAFYAGQRTYLRHAAAAPGIAVPAGEASPLPGGAPLPSEDGVGMLVARNVPDALPSFTLAGRDGRPQSIDAWRGHSLIINFWATWCAPCRRELPLLAALQRDWEPRGFTLVGVAVDERDKVLAFAAQNRIGYPLLIGEQDALDAAAALGVASPAFPFTVFTDRRGAVVALYLGELHKAQADLILSAVQGVNQDRVALPAARRAIADGLDQLSRNSTT